MIVNGLSIEKLRTMIRSMPGQKRTEWLRNGSDGMSGVIRLYSDRQRKSARKKQRSTSIPAEKSNTSENSEVFAENDNVIKLFSIHSTAISRDSEGSVLPYKKRL